MTNNEVKSQIALGTFFEIKNIREAIRSIDNLEAIDTLAQWYANHLVWLSSKSCSLTSSQWNNFTFNLKEGLIKHPLISTEGKRKVSNGWCFMVNQGWAKIAFYK